MHFSDRKRLSSFFLLLIFTIVFWSCKQKLGYQPELSFYYWKNKFSISVSESKKLEELQVKKLYLKVFDLTVDSETNTVRPVAVVTIPDLAKLHEREVIPCIFIENHVFQVTEDKDIEPMVTKIIYKIKSLIGERFTEVHIDCDWTKTTKEPFFSFLTKLSELSGKEISCTIRLHQIKYAKATGVPPVLRGVLMCYNMGVIQKEKETNSIFNLELVKNYTKNIKNYPLKLDIALPIFSWNVVFREEKFLFISSTPFLSMEKGKFTYIKDNLYKCIAGTRLGDRPVLKGDVVRQEAPNQEDLKECILLFSQLLHRPSFIFYHLNKQNIETYETVFNYCATN
jgi:hypothetical protein